MSTTVEFTRSFAAAHRVWNDPGACRNVHGHNYLVHVRVSSVQLTEQNFVVSFATVKSVIDPYDHTLILDILDPLLDQFYALDLALTIVPGVPSTEFLATKIANDLAALLYAGSYVVVTVRETDGIEARAEATSP